MRNKKKKTMRKPGQTLACSLPEPYVVDLSKFHEQKNARHILLTDPDYKISVPNLIS